MKKTVKKYSKIAFILGGLTNKLQPLDLSVNKSFKNKMRNKGTNGWLKDSIRSLKLAKLDALLIVKFVSR